MGLEPGEIPLPGRRVNDKAVTLFPAIGNEVVNYAAGLIEQSAVAGLPRGKGRHVLRQQALEVGRRVNT